MVNDETTLVDLEKQVTDLEDQIEKLGAKGGLHYPEADDADMTGSAKDNKGDHKRKESKHTQQVKKLEEELEKAKAKAKAAEEDAADGGADDDEEDSSGKVKKAKSKKPPMDEEDAADGGSDDWSEEADSKKMPKTKKTYEDDESVVIEGQRIAKSEVGGSQFEIFKSMSDRIEKQGRELAKARDDAEMERLKKRADDQYAHVPGTAQERAFMLKAISAMPEDLRKSFDKVLTQAEKLAKAAFAPLGVSAGRGFEDMQKSRQDFETKCLEIQKRDNCSRTDAMAKARKEDPAAYEAYQGN